MVNSERAEEIRQYLVRHLQQNPFGDIVEEANNRIRLRQEDPKYNYELEPPELLITFLDEVMNTLSNWFSNHLSDAVVILNRVLGEGEQGLVSSVMVALTEEMSAYITLVTFPITAT